MLVAVHMLKAAVADAVVVLQRALILMAQMHGVLAAAHVYKCPTVGLAKTRHVRIDRQRAAQDIAHHRAQTRRRCFRD